MISACRAQTAIKFERERLPAVLGTLDAKGWKPAAYAAEREFLAQAGLDDAVSSVRFMERRFGGRSAVGDVFFRDGDIYFLQLANAEMYFERDGRVGVEVSDDATLEIGVLSPEGGDSGEKRAVFAAAVEDAVKSSVDGRRARHMRFDWQEGGRDDAPSRIASILSDPGEGEAAFTTADLKDEEVAGAEALADEPIREMLIEISKAGFVRAHDLGARWGRRLGEKDTGRALESLKKAGLVTTKYLLACRSDGTPLIQFDDPAQMKAAGHLPHAGCGRQFNDELLQEGYSVSPLGRLLIQKSHWMTVLVTRELVKTGVPSDSIYWNMTEGGEEVDIVLAFLDEVWIVELKDRDFGPGDAYPFNYRRARYSPQRALIVTTGKVTADARRVFDEMTRESADRPGGRRAAVRPQYIEGLRSVEASLRAVVSSASLAHAERHLAPLSAATGYDLRQVVAARFA